MFGPGLGSPPAHVRSRVISGRRLDQSVGAPITGLQGFPLLGDFAVFQNALKETV